MTDDLTLHEYVDEEFPGAMAIVSFPSVGLVSSIAANFVIRNMGLERIAAIISKDFPPYTMIYQGVPSPPVRVFAGDRVCDETGEQCEQLVVITAEFMPKPELMIPLAELIMDWCDRKKISTIVTLEGINLGIDPEEGEIMGVGGSQRSRELMESYGIKRLEEGMVSGVSGVLLYEADRRGKDLMCLLGPARTNYPDARGAARLLEVISRMLPELKLDPEPLYEEAEQIEQQMKKAMEAVQQPPGAKELPEQSIIYG